MERHGRKWQVTLHLSASEPVLRKNVPFEEIIPALLSAAKCNHNSIQTLRYTNKGLQRTEDMHATLRKARILFQITRHVLLRGQWLISGSTAWTVNEDLWQVITISLCCSSKNDDLAISQPHQGGLNLVSWIQVCIFNNFNLILWSKDLTVPDKKVAELYHGQGCKFTLLSKQEENNNAKWSYIRVPFELYTWRQYWASTTRVCILKSCQVANIQWTLRSQEGVEGKQHKHHGHQIIFYLIKCGKNSNFQHIIHKD